MAEMVQSSLGLIGASLVVTDSDADFSSIREIRCNEDLTMNVRSRKYEIRELSLPRPKAIRRKSDDLEGPRSH